jgi:hypothetical protein
MSGLTCEVVLHPESKSQATVAMFPQAPIAKIKEQALRRNP